ncbi:MAG TPA: histidine phosphatase family protein [Nocardioides sp.]|uniref:SixA phosphatase family protein n=1 Tax=Nocardioides sp. TaxID=35761 RepID=UPI002D7F5A2F|nr:histidine phosphatase family protein [Nocardioides sp.]HET6653562.1 histidine phosphatase family protein [Nocardioides sp.]
MTGRRQLIVMRHGKAEPFAATDHVRALTDRGHADAAAAGTWLAGLRLVPDHAVVSTAVRARETWFDLARAAGSDIEPVFDEGLYQGGVDAALESLQSVPEDAGTVILIGHNPAAAYLAHMLDDGEGDDEAISGMLRGFPPGAAVVFDVEVGWSDLATEAGRVTGFHAP